MIRDVLKLLKLCMKKQKYKYLFERLMCFWGESNFLGRFMKKRAHFKGLKKSVIIQESISSNLHERHLAQATVRLLPLCLCHGTLLMVHTVRTLYVR